MVLWSSTCVSRAPWGLFWPGICISMVLVVCFDLEPVISIIHVPCWSVLTWDFCLAYTTSSAFLCFCFFYLDQHATQICSPAKETLCESCGVQLQRPRNEEQGTGQSASTSSSQLQAIESSSQASFPDDLQHLLCIITESKFNLRIRHLVILTNDT